MGIYCRNDLCKKVKIKNIEKEYKKLKDYQITDEKELCKEIKKEIEKQ